MRLQIWKLGGVFALVVLLALAVPTAQALKVVNTTQGVTLFEHDYENGTVGEGAETAAPSVGTWEWSTSPKPPTPGAAFYSDVDPYEGAQHLEMTDGLGYLGAVFDGPSEAGDVLEISYAFRSQGIWFHFLSTNDDPTDSPLMDLCPVGLNSGWGDYWDDPGAFYPFPPDGITQRHDPSAWNTMEIVYVNGSTDISMSVNGGGEVLAINGAPGNVTHMFFGDEGPWAGSSYLDTISGGAVELMADFNNDGVIDDLDLTILANNWDQCGKTHEEGDANDDGCVDDLDLTALANEWPAGDLDVSAVPEPATLSLLALGGVGILLRRRRK